MFHLISIWMTRIIVVGVAIALTVMYVIPAYFGEQPAPGSAPQLADRPMARMAPPTAPAAVSDSTTQAAAPAAPSEVAAAGVANDQPQAEDKAAAEAGSTRPCLPIARTASGDLVYSMDCRQLPAE